MRFLSLVFIPLLLTFGGWETDFEKAQKTAAEEHKLILLNFSGSDWCIPCIRLHKELFEDDSFKDFAKENLILVDADFPRLKKNQLSKEQQKKNEALAEKYNPQGSFPLTLLVNARGEVLQSWDGYIEMPPDLFISAIKKHQVDSD